MSPPPAAQQVGGLSCRSGNLTLRAARMEGATGHMVTVLAFTNRSGTACRMSGSPSLELRDANDHPVPVAISHESGFMLPDNPPSEVTLPPNGEAFFGVEWTSICAAELGGGAPMAHDRVTAGSPGESPTLGPVPARVGLCPGGALGVGPVRASDAVTW